MLDIAYCAQMSAGAPDVAYGAQMSAGAPDAAYGARMSRLEAPDAA